MTKGWPDFAFSTYVKTLEADNIIIDKLRTGAYTEERKTLSNRGATAAGYFLPHTYMIGKYFPRGCRGFIKNIVITARNTDSTSHDVNVYISPQPGMGKLVESTFTVPADTDPTEFTVSINRYWNYDSIFVWLYTDATSGVGIAYDAGEPYDAYHSSDGVAWTVYSRRYWIDIEYSGQTVGDLPVSGTLNTIEVPHSSSHVESGSVSLAGLAEDVELVSINGAGYCDLIIFQVQANTDSHNVGIKVECDGQTALESLMYVLNGFGCGNTTQPILLTQYSENGYIVLMLTKKFEFIHKFRVLAYNSSTTDQTVSAYAIVSLIK